MKIENTQVFGFKAAIRGMRNSFDSHQKSDSWVLLPEDGERERYILGLEDLALACKLIKAGPSHRKFLRQIMVWVDLTLARFIWTEFDTYKVGTVRNSQSSWHTAGSGGLLTHLDFEYPIPQETIDYLNELRMEYGITRDKNYLLMYKACLPEAFLQKSTITTNYETLLSMYFQRKNHPFPQWSSQGGICEWIATLPYMKEFIEAAKGNKDG